MIELLFDPLFRVPFLTGLLLAPLVALLGTWLRLREEWLASLAYAQVAAAGGMMAVVLHGPVLAGALLAAVALALLKGTFRRTGNNHFALAFLFGWGVMLLLAGYSSHGAHVGDTMLDGQLYFTSAPHLIAAVALALVVAVALPWLSPRLLLERFFPDHFSANRLPAWPHRFVFDLLVVLAIAVSTTVFGVMAAFTLVFIPSWVAWHVAVGWRQVLAVSTLLALVAYLVAFVLAIAGDQPFGPVLVLVLGSFALARLLPVGCLQRLTRSP